jgi:hypothetical protein
MNTTHRLLLLCSVLAVARASAEPAWPDVAAADGTVVTSVARQTTLNGLPMEIQLFSSRKTPAELLDFYRRIWGERHVENSLRGTTILGRAQGEFYTTVQIKPSINGAQGVIAVTRLKPADRDPRKEFQPPLGSRMLSDMASEDAGKTSRHLVFTNTQPVDLNRDRLVDQMKEKGMSLQRIGKQGDDGDALFFAGQNKEAIAVITRAGDHTSVVLNITSILATVR